jgi:hypothetical protein
MKSVRLAAPVIAILLTGVSTCWAQRSIAECPQPAGFSRIVQHATPGTAEGPGTPVKFARISADEAIADAGGIDQLIEKGEAWIIRNRAHGAGEDLLEIGAKNVRYLKCRRDVERRVAQGTEPSDRLSDCRAAVSIAEIGTQSGPLGTTHKYRILITTDVPLATVVYQVSRSYTKNDGSRFKDGVLWTTPVRNGRSEEMGELFESDALRQISWGAENVTCKKGPRS